MDTYPVIEMHSFFMLSLPLMAVLLMKATLCSRNWVSQNRLLSL